MYARHGVLPASRIARGIKAFMPPAARARLLHLVRRLIPWSSSMSRRLVFVVAWLLVLSFLTGSAIAAEISARPANGLLWKVERAGLPPSYVFGTIHMADPRVTTLPAPVQ